jgi:hypothetical protein
MAKQKAKDNAGMYIERQFSLAIFTDSPGKVWAPKTHKRVLSSAESPGRPVKVTKLQAQPSARASKPQGEILVT